ncbi:hypothetical protein SCP_0102810 [Sparassis crispa]|uniref:Uncharacterized protein n=1 Tax=Sparassis crispa TaxID=139825 RepID=A0A401G5G8_9APHY|nr:hypothetical protein SCP_0102810 [Sparassis crispa]GBE77408.1 hypothetical protein SCP_0102810 [Sparassis crispa]
MSFPCFLPYANGEEYLSAAIVPPSLCEPEDEFEIDPCQAVFLEDFRKEISKYTTRELAGSVPNATKVALIESFQQDWKNCARLCVEKTAETLRCELDALILVYFSTFPLLRLDVTNIAAEIVDAASQKALDLVLKLFQLETTPRVGSNMELRAIKYRFAQRYDSMRRGMADLQPYNTELSVMAEIRAYFSISHQRFISNVLAAISSELVDVISGNLEESLFRELGINSHYLDEGAM